MKTLGRYCLIISAALILLPHFAQARVVLLLVSSDDPYNMKIAAGFKKSFGALYEELNLFGLEDRSRNLGEKLVAEPPRLMVVIGNLAAKTAKQYCNGCPILYAAANNPEVINLAGANVFGISSLPTPAKVMENLRLAFPDMKRVGLIYQPKYVGKYEAQIQAEAGKAGLSLNAVAISETKEIPRVFEQISANIDILLLIEDPGVVNDDTLPYLFINSFKKKIPLFVSSEELLKKCGMAGYGHDPEQLGGELANMASEILAEKNPPNHIKTASGNLVLNKKIAQMYNYNFSAPVNAKGITIQ